MSEIKQYKPYKPNQTIQADIRENKGEREKRQKEEKKEEEAEEKKKNTPPSFLPELLSTKNHPPKKVCGPYIKFVNLMCGTGQSPLSSLFEKRKQPTSKKKFFIRNFWSDVFCRRKGGDMEN